MAESDRPHSVPESRRGLESVVRLYVSRPGPDAHKQPAHESAPLPAGTVEERAVRAFDARSGVEGDSILEEGAPGLPHRPAGSSLDQPAGDESDAAAFEFEAGPAHDAGWAGDELPPLVPEDELPAIGEETLPLLRVGQEALHAEAAFRLEGELIVREALADHPEIEIVFAEDQSLAPAPIAALGAAPAVELESRPAAARPVPHAALLIGATPLRLRRMLLEALAAPVASEGRGVLLLESALPLDDATAMLEVALDRGTPITRRNLGVSARDMLLLSPEERQSIFADLTFEERRADLIVIDLELPESILCPRLQFLVDTIVVALTSNESSLYEAYRALRGLRERRPGMHAFVVPFASSAEEAGFLLERFRVIAEQFLKLPVLDGGWLALPGREAVMAGRESPSPRLSGEIVLALKSPPVRPPEREDFVTESEHSFFVHLRDWFGPPSVS